MKWIAFALALCLITTAGRADEAPAAFDVTLTLARQLSAQRDAPGAALEFRRLALMREGEADAAAYYWASAREYGRFGRFEVADRMLDEAEDRDPDAWPSLMALARADLARASGREGEAIFYLENLIYGEAALDEKDYAARRLAALRLRQGNVEEAREVLASAPTAHPGGVAALDRYAAGRDKRPWVGGLLGAIPGFGYFYAGEYANGFRSIILNALFIYGMVDTAQNDQWGGFAAITFFQITWYTGSIYGGIDASHRYNRARVEEAASGVMGAAAWEPDYRALPLLQLQFSF